MHGHIFFCLVLVVIFARLASWAPSAFLFFSLLHLTTSLFSARCLLGSSMAAWYLVVGSCKQHDLAAGGGCHGATGKGCSNSRGGITTYRSYSSQRSSISTFCTSNTRNQEQEAAPLAAATNCSQEATVSSRNCSRQQRSRRWTCTISMVSAAQGRSVAGRVEMRKVWQTQRPIICCVQRFSSSSGMHVDLQSMR